MNLKDLKYIVAVSECLNFTKAAEKCFISQPTLSYQIKKFEAFVGVQLFERNKQKVWITEAGKPIIQKANVVLQAVEDLLQAAEVAHDPFLKPLRVGAFPTLSIYLYPTLMHLIRKNQPKLKLILREEKTLELVNMLRSGILDAIFLALPSFDISGSFIQEHAFVELFKDPFYLALNRTHPWATQSNVDITNLKKLRGDEALKLMLLTEGHCLRGQALSFCQAHQWLEDGEVSATSLETIRQMVALNLGMTLMPKIALNYVKDENIKYLPFSGVSPSRTIALFWRKNSSRKLAIQILKQQCLQVDVS